MATSSANRAVVNCVFDSPAQSLFRCVRSKSGAISKLFSCDFSVMPFSNEDKILIKHYRLDKGYGAKRLLIEFPDKGWTLGGVRTLLEKIDQTGSVDRQEGSGRPRTARNKDWAGESKTQLTTARFALLVAMFTCCFQLWFSTHDNFGPNDRISTYYTPFCRKFIQL